MPDEFDFLIVSDLSRSPDLCLRIRQEVRSLHSSGFSVALVNAEFGEHTPVLPDIQAVIRDGWATPIPPDETIHAKIAIVHAPGQATVQTPRLAARADHVLLVHNRIPRLEQMGLWHVFSIGPVTWVPTNRWVRQGLEALDMPVKIEPEDWRSVGDSSLRPSELLPDRKRLLVGRISNDDSDQWPTDPARLSNLYRLPRGWDGIALGATSKGEVRKTLKDLRWSVMTREQISVDRLVDMLDVLLYFPGKLPAELPETSIATALKAGKLVILPEFLRGHFGEGPFYAEPEDVPDLLRRLARSFAALEESDLDLQARRERAKAAGALLFSEENLLAQLRRLLPSSAAHPAPPVIRKKRKQALFVASNGVGLGHVTRLLAIARRLGDDIEPVFLTLADSGPLVQSFGFHMEYLPSYGSLGLPIAQWDTWFLSDLRQCIDRYDVSAVVYDGNNPTNGLVEAALSHGECALCWVRRGMYGTANAPYIENSRYFDLIIEPGEIAASEDIGITAKRRHEALVTGPITLLDREEVLSREEAAAALGLDTSRQSVLVHLGGGPNRNLPDLTGQIIHHLRSIPGIQIVLTEWANGAYAFPPFPDVRFLTGFPISQYFRAFDFSISSSGYNSFHEVMAFELPTIFFPNRDPSLDDQGARAQFAQTHSAGFDLAEVDIGMLPAILRAMTAENVRAVLRKGCADLARPNGAIEAANAVREVVLSR